MTLLQPLDLFDQFRATLGHGDPIATLRAGLIGKGAPVHGPFGPKPLVYADYTASGRALMQVERFVQEQILPYYANSHTEASYCGALMTRWRRAARAEIARACGAGPEHAVIFCGAGATAGINRLVHLLGLPEAVGARPLVILGPYEHHSNILPWRESGAEVVMLGEDPAGGPDRAALARLLAEAKGRPVVGAFSAASNVTGRLTDVAAVTRMLKAAGARAVWDYAAGGPYLPVAMTPAPDAPIDALVISPHKFIGGPGASGLLILRRDAVQSPRPSLPGGGTVRFVSARAHDYAGAVEQREEAGTPNVLGDLRAALAFAVREAVGTARIAEIHATLRARADAALSGQPRIELLGGTAGERLPIYALRLRDAAGAELHPQLVTRLLSDCHGVQARGGCACAGPYALALLGIDADGAARLRADILAGQEARKPGFVRLNLSYLHDAAEVAHILAAVTDIAERSAELAPRYRCDPARAVFEPA